MRKKIKPIIAYSLVGLLAAGLLSGCKETDVLKEIIYGDDTRIVDYDQQQVDNDETNTEEDPDLFAITDSDDSDQKESETVNEDDDNADSSDTPAVERQTDDEAVTTGEAGNKDSDETEENTKDKSEGKEKQTKDGEETTKNGKKDSEETGEGEETEENPSEEETGEGEGDTPVPSYSSAKSDPDNPHQTIDENGNHTEVPTNANIVVAAGEAAIMVEMLGENTTGHDILFGTNANLLNSSLATTVFPDLINGQDQNGNKVQALWDGDGSSPMTDEGFNILLQNADNVDVCFVIDGVTSFSTDQLTQLDAAGVAVVTLYKMNTPENIEKNATLIGKILGNHSKQSVSAEGVNSSQVAKNYVKWVKNEVIAAFNGQHFTDVQASVFLETGGTETNDALNNSNGRYTVIADYWDDTAQINLDHGNGNVESIGQGAAAATAGYYYSPVSYFMQIAGVVNTAAAQVDNWPSLKSINLVWYLNQYATGAGIIKITGTYGEYRAGYQGADSEIYSGPYLSAVGTDKTYSNIKAYLGTDKFSKVIAANNNVAQKLVSSVTFNQNGIAALEGQNVATIQGSYDIVVNPCGVGNWIKGSAESPLESFWIYETFFGNSIDGKTLYDEAKYFYTTFYRCDETTFEGIYNTILAGQ